MPHDSALNIYFIIYYKVVDFSFLCIAFVRLLIDNKWKYLADISFMPGGLPVHKKWGPLRWPVGENPLFLAASLHCVKDDPLNSCVIAEGNRN